MSLPRQSPCRKRLADPYMCLVLFGLHDKAEPLGLNPPSTAASDDISGSYFLGALPSTVEGECVAMLSIHVDRTPV